MEFTVALVLIKLYPNSLLLVSLYGLLDNGIRISMGSRMGRYVDRTERWLGARNCYLLQNVCIIGAGLSMAAVMAGLVGQPGNPAADDVVKYWVVVASGLLLSSSSSVGSTGVMIAVEKSMPKLLCGDDSNALSTMNSVFRAIDLVCLLASPILSGVLMTYWSPLSAVLVLTAYAALAWVPELTLLRWAVAASSRLSAPKHKAASNSAAAAVISDAKEGSNDASSQQATSKKESTTRPGDWAVYCQQSVVLANLALALLYMTVLSMGFLMTSYLKWAGLTEAEVSLYRGVGAITGLIATAIYPSLRTSIGLVKCGFLGISYQLLCLIAGVLPVLYYTLSPCWASAFAPGQPSGLFGSSMIANAWQALVAASEGPPAVPSLPLVRLLICGVVASRTGLWLFDLAVSQLVQERVPHSQLGTVCGVQSSIQAGFGTFSFLAATFLRDPTQFWALMLASLAVVGAAFLLYIVFMLRGSSQGQGQEREPLLPPSASPGSLGATG